MKQHLLIAALLPAAAAFSSSLGDVKTVYVLPMTSGIDQYLANRLQAGQVVAVTTNPEAADAVLTDAIGPAFEKRLEALYPTPPPPKPEKEEKKDEDEEAAKSKDIIGKDEPVVRTSSFRKGRGVLFLVDRRTRQVVWSTQELPKNSTPKELDRAARRMSERLKRDYSGKQGN